MCYEKIDTLLGKDRQPVTKRSIVIIIISHVKSQEKCYEKIDDSKTSLNDIKITKYIKSKNIQLRKQKKCYKKIDTPVTKRSILSFLTRCK